MCPSCALAHSLEERFCSQCRIPLVYGGREAAAPVTERRRQARKIKPQYAEGQLVRVAGARNQAEAELIQGMLLEEGVPSVLRRTRGFDVPDFLAAGPRDVLVPVSGAGPARDVLLEAELVGEERPSGAAPARLLTGLLAGLLLLAGVLWLGTELLG